MKTLLSILLVVLVGTATQASSPDRATKILTLEGKFLEKKVVKYELYSMSADSCYEKISSNQGIGTFSLTLNVGHHYMIKFTSISGKVKYLYVDALGGGGFMIDVNFHNEHSARLTLERGSYSLQILDPEEAKAMAYVTEKEGS